MATIKGQNLRVLLGDDDEHLACVAAATNCLVHLSLEMQENTTKDTDDDWIPMEPAGINWDVSVDALVLLDDEETGITVNSLQIGRVYRLRFAQTAGATGEQNRDAIANVLQLTGNAILSDLQLTAQNQDESQYTAKFTGHGDLTQYTPPTQDANNGND